MDTKDVLKTASMDSMMPIFFMIFGIVVVLGLIWYIRQLAMNTASNACYRLSEQERVTTLSSISYTDTMYELPLHSYMIKTSYNSCATGPFKRSWVDLCALTSVISQGCRVLDFEVYNIHDEPAVAASSTTEFYEKGTYNSIPFGDVIQCIAENAFTPSKCPNSNDPLFLNFRIKSANKDIYNKMALALEKLDDRMLSSEYSYEYLKDKTSSNLSNVSVHKLIGKVIVMVDTKTIQIQDSKLYEYVNIAGNSMFMRIMDNETIQHDNQSETIDFNKCQITMSTPVLADRAVNYDATIMKSYGVQMIAMCFQTNYANDVNLQVYIQWFNDARSAFLIKPLRLRGVCQEVVESTVVIPEENSYAPKIIETPLVKLEL